MTTQEQYSILHQQLNERQWRLYLATEAEKIGYGGISQVARLSGSDWKTIQRGEDDLMGDMPLPEGRVRKIGGGRKKIIDTDQKLLDDIDILLVDERQTKGNPMNFVKWTNKAVAQLVEGLHKLGHTIKNTALYNILKKEHYSMRGNKKDDEGASPVDRDYQFRKINQKCEEFAAANNPILSIDCKKKEKLGNFKNNGVEWKKKGKQHDTRVNTYDFWSLAKGVVNPYGIYDVLRKHGFINVGIDHDTAAFAVSSIKKWWKNFGKIYYPYATGILITADGGGSNGVRNRLFKRELQMLVNAIQIPITVAHFPPATSKWNVIEHQLFSFISINWRARPLTSLAVVLELISHTTTKSGLEVTAMPDMHNYPTGIKVTDEEIDALNIRREEIHGEWNYTIAPQTPHAVAISGSYL
jgi:hypothetical protein